jgi:hypothetical protein
MQLVFPDVDAIAMRCTERPISDRGSMSIFITCQLKKERLSKGQALTEYTMILLTIAVLVYAVYLVVGGELASLVNSAAVLF